MTLYKSDLDYIISKYIDEVRSGVIGCNEALAMLAKEDDWSFVIKSHALIETIITQMIVEHSGDNKFEKIIKRLPLSDSQIGKAALCKELGLLNKTEISFIRFYSELRNSLVHNFENIHFNFQRYLREIDNNQKKKFYSNVLWFVKDEKDKSLWDFEKYKNTKIGLWLAIMQLFIKCTLVINEKQTNKQVELKMTETSEELLSALLRDNE